MSLHCPACGHKQICPCPNCRNSRRAKGEDVGISPWKWIGGFGIRCGGCGFEGSSDFWADLELKVYYWGDRAILDPIKKDLTDATIKFLDKLKANKYKTKETNYGEETDH